VSATQGSITSNAATRTIAIAARVLMQIRSDKRTVGLMFVVPSALVGLFSWMLGSQQAFDRVGGRLVGLFPFVVMFLAASIATLRERRSGTLERFLTTPMRKGEFIAGYALAFALMAVVQAAITLGFASIVCGLDLRGDFGLIFLAACANALSGMALGLLLSAFATTEFQVIQFMPAFVFPQIILGGLFVPVDQMPEALRTLSDWMPLTHCLRAIVNFTDGRPFGDVMAEIWIVLGVAIMSLALGALTLKRRTR